MINRGVKKDDFRACLRSIWFRLYKVKRLVADECHSGCGFGLHCNWGWDWITLNKSDWYVVKILYL